jgi:hypothetical protein
MHDSRFLRVRLTCVATAQNTGTTGTAFTADSNANAFADMMSNSVIRSPTNKSA